MSGFSFDANIILDLFEERGLAEAEVYRASQQPGGAWISRMVWPATSWSPVETRA